jgi:hypothetical protein
VVDEEPAAAVLSRRSIWRDPDTRDIPPVAAFDLSKSYEFLNETRRLGALGPALNVNTLGAVPTTTTNRPAFTT